MILLPYLGVFIYLIVRGGGMQERRIADARASQEAMAQSSGDRRQRGCRRDRPRAAREARGSRDRGVISDEEFAAQKAKLLG